MFWVALATAIMMLSGEGDDARAIALLIAGLRQAVEVHVPAGARRARALEVIRRFGAEFSRHRNELVKFGKCVEAADRRYGASPADYAACEARIEAERTTLARSLDEIVRDYDAAVEPPERALVARDVTALPEAWVLDPSLVEPESAEGDRRFRGLEGVAARRHLTLPRNVVGIVYGPLGPATFGQRFPSKIVDAGTSFERDRIHGSTASASPVDAWHTRLGCRFGLFDDLEGGAVFLPFQLSPSFEFEPVLAFVTWQLRFDAFDLAFRFTLETPGDLGWGLGPGVLLGTRGRVAALQAGVFGPMEIGKLSDPEGPHAGVVAPLRLTLNVLPSLFVTTESGLSYDYVEGTHAVSIPLGFGAGYAFLMGSRLIEATASFTWDRFLLPGRPNGLDVLQPEAFRAAFGASMYFQAF